MNRIYTYTVLLGLIALGTSSCTKNFAEYNRDQAGITEEELMRTPVGGSQLQDLMIYVLPNQENSYQMCFDLIKTFSGFGSETKFTGDFSRYNPRRGWNDYPFDDTMSKHLNPQFGIIRNFANGNTNQPFYALGSILRVAITHRLSDTYGPMPYSKIKGLSLQVEYDTQQELYSNMMRDLKQAAIVLDEQAPNYDQYRAYDPVYSGDVHKWARYARSLLLRMAIRISSAAPGMAKEYAEWAVANGVIETNADNAAMPSIDNPLYKIAYSWCESRPSADIVEYMKAFKDPRLPAFFTSVREGTYFGLRTPAEAINSRKDLVGNGGGDYGNAYSMYNIKKNSPIYWLTAAEVAFLKAEGKLLGWNMGSKDAKELYEKGITLSCEQWGVAPGNYFQQTGKREGFFDSVQPNMNMPSFHSDITVSWDSAAGNIEKQKARIITQKWISLYPYNIVEAWAEWRRTGYPNLMPMILNSSGGTVKDITQVDGRDTGGMRRLKFTQKDKDQNAEGLAIGLKDLAGEDSFATDLWWAK